MVFNKPGLYEYGSLFHPWMVANTSKTQIKISKYIFYDDTIIL